MSSCSDAAAARRLHRVLFGREPSPETVERFTAAAAILRDRFPAELEASRRALAVTRRPEALELAARLSGRLPGLVREMRVMVRIGEVDPANRAALYGGPRHPLARIVILVEEGLRTVALVPSGLWELARVRRG